VFDRLMEEDPKYSVVRNQLKADKIKFEKAMESIHELEDPSSDGDDLIDNDNGSGGI
jgi:hypothetical protein